MWTTREAGKCDLFWEFICSTESQGFYEKEEVSWKSLAERIWQGLLAVQAGPFLALWFLSTLIKFPILNPWSYLPCPLRMTICPSLYQQNLNRDWCGLLGKNKHSWSKTGYGLCLELRKYFAIKMSFADKLKSFLHCSP